MEMNYASSIIQIIYLILAGAGIYLLVLLIRLARKSLHALDLYIEEKRSRRPGDS